MRTLATLAAILLVALQAQAQPSLARADKIAAQEQPGAEDRDFAISFTRDASSDFRASGPGTRLMCSCRIGVCRLEESVYGTCTSDGIQYIFCCL
ncbi:defensin alpha 5-like [Saimiri boliviensis]|uniref:defensin alpha 5-like n=1 Tax=Saimiri boliviensis TaxID=27679 RepID=UPI00193D9628|nr:defensin-5-like [Saimiri boliviensis boliviensis]